MIDEQPPGAMLKAEVFEFHQKSDHQRVDLIKNEASYNKTTSPTSSTISCECEKASQQLSEKSISFRDSNGGKDDTSPDTAGMRVQSMDLPPHVTPRPQIDVPGFEGILTCCADWPQTKKGGPPSAQSAIFNPLLACTLGYIPNHCTEQQIQYAIMWWREVFPAFPRWVQELRGAGLTMDSVEGKKLMDSISVPKNKSKGKKNGKTSANGDDSALSSPSGAVSRPSNTNNLIFKHSKEIYGDVPHFKGRAQNNALELSPMTAVEVYACVTCVYSLAAYY
eukprot:CAMPEP_0114485964 /NCGR_PEP_ID=MMETSP0104-20121206/20224_1 /TAXON_ID=37642 ORGANISM="Paraphysomonas imperforata, Strain PA2" /NCGR_SAMPLE_ID=MMETSP0104 /ASSEMBLY_ACC=CAM_ASM_000202 /LENGTH=278 /DNA_ID=CAMNT_0001662107 /DNA_START=292 /DNA_END=1128 /DNA_ORIENTATION=+